MGSWNEKLSWCFSPLGSGPKVGVNDAGIGIFKKRPYISLAKEILQNVIDAKDHTIDAPAQACFEIINIERKDIPDGERLSQVIKSCYDYYHDGDDGIKMGFIKDAAKEFLDGTAPVPVLKISDYNTLGLTGAKEEKGSNWTGLIREVGATNKGNGKSGSFGVGKFAPFNFSSIRTIIYSTANKDGDTALQGKTILTAFRDVDGKVKQNVGLFGFLEDGDSKAVYDFNDVPEIYRRDKNKIGTDLFVLGVKKDQDWMDQIALCVLDYFFYTIYQNDLEVIIKDVNKEIIINKKNLPELMAKYTAYCEENDINFDAPIFWEVLNDTSGKTKKFTATIRNKGEVELYLCVDSDFYDKRILQMRKAGMKIQEDTAFRIGAYFHGIFIATGKGSKSDNPEDNINSFLRKCENQAHDTWSESEYDGNQEEAKKTLKEIHSWILEKVKSVMPKEEAAEVDAYGLSDLLPNQFGDSEEDMQEIAYASFEPLPLEVAAVKVKKGTRSISDISVSIGDKKQQPGSVIIPDPDGDEIINTGKVKEEPPIPPTPVPPIPVPPVPVPPEPKPQPEPEPDPNPEGPEQISGSTDKTNKTNSGKTALHNVPLSNIKTPFNSKEETFIVSFVPQRSCDDVFIRLRIGSDDEDKRNAEIRNAIYEGHQLELYKEFIRFGCFEKGKKIIIRVELKNAKRCPLEVSAYVK